MVGVIERKRVTLRLLSVIHAWGGAVTVVSAMTCLTPAACHQGT